MRRIRIVALALSCALSTAAAAEVVDSAAPSTASEDAAPGLPFEAGDVVRFDQIGRLQPYLPPRFWEHREFFFYEGMRLEIGPSFREYGESEAYRNVTLENRGKASIGPDGALEGHTGGLPFPTAEIDCADPEAGSKIAWNFTKAWNGAGTQGRFLFTMWNRGEKIAMYHEGTTKQALLKGRVEPRYREDPEAPGEVFENDERVHVIGYEMTGPESHSFYGGPYRLLNYRFESAEGPLDGARRDELWVYVPKTQQVYQWIHRREEALSEFTFDDVRSFSGAPPQYDWTCLGERDVIAPFNTKRLAYPYRDDYDFGPYGASYASDRWELRKAWVVRLAPKEAYEPLHPYHHKVLYIDRETYEPLYSFAYDLEERLWKIIWHNHRYSEDWDGTTPERTDPLAEDGVWYRGWEGVAAPMDLRTVSDIIVNVQTAMVNRTEYWGSHGMPFETLGKLRKYIDVGRLARSRTRGNYKTPLR